MRLKYDLPNTMNGVIYVDDLFITPHHSNYIIEQAESPYILFISFKSKIGFIFCRTGSHCSFSCERMSFNPFRKLTQSTSGSVRPSTFPAPNSKVQNSLSSDLVNFLSSRRSNNLCGMPISLMRCSCSV